MTALAGFAAAGFLFATSALNSHGLDLRASSVTDLDTVLRHDRARVDDLQGRVADLNAQVSRLGKQVDDRRVRRLQRRVDRLRVPAGFTAVTGPGVRVTLDDAPKDEINQIVESGTVSADTLVVHQQDIQAVVNALWAGGAEAVTVQGQRVISTTGVKCVGNTVVLQGVPYAPPYRIAAVGNPVALTQALDDSEYIAAYRTVADRYHLTWDVRALTGFTAPAYVGTPDLRYARLGDTSS